MYEFGDEYAGLGDASGAVVCPEGLLWDPVRGHCAPIPMPPPTVPPQVSGYYAGAGEGDIPPDLFGADAIQRGCVPGQYWDGWYRKCAPLVQPRLPSVRTGQGGDPLHPICPENTMWSDAAQKCVPLGASLTGPYCSPGTYWDDLLKKCLPVHGGAVSPMPATFADWRAQHATSGCYVGDDIYAVGAAATNDAMVHADNAAAQAQSAQAAATHPAAKDTTATQSAQAASAHANQAAMHAQAATQKAPTKPHEAIAHAEQAKKHTHAAAHHAREAHGALHRGHAERHGFGRERFGRERFGRERFGRGREFGRREWWRRPEFAEYERFYGHHWWLRPEFAQYAQLYGGVEDVVIPEYVPEYVPEPVRVVEEFVVPADDGGDEDDVGDDDGDAGDGGDDDAAVQGDYAGWQDPFTTPYPGYFNPYMPAAWDSSFEYPFLVPYW
jgi:hypothetical protein